MPLALAGDANDWLDTSKLSFADEASAEPDADNADNIVKSYLAGNWPEEVLLWDAADPTPSNKEPPPKIVREAASMLMASFLYRRKYSEETDETPQYADDLRKEAIDLLTKIRDGDISLWDKSYGQKLYDRLVREDYWPNDSLTRSEIEYDEWGEAVRTVRVPDRAFTMDKRF